MPGLRVDRLLASTAIALLLALPATAFAGSENGVDASAAPRQELQADSTSQPAVSEPAQKASNDEPLPTAKPQETAAPTNNSAQNQADEAKPAAASDMTPAAAGRVCGRHRTKSLGSRNLARVECRGHGAPAAVSAIN